MKPGYGSITKENDGYRVRFERILNHPVSVVWDAITDKKKLAIWFTDMDFIPQAGADLTIWFKDEQRTKSSGKIIRFDPPNVFEFSWEEELATWELFDAGKGMTKLVLTYSKLPDEYAFSVPAGWHLLLDQLLEVLNGRMEPFPFDGKPTPEGERLKSEYQEIVRGLI